MRFSAGMLAALAALFVTAVPCRSEVKRTDLFDLLMPGQKETERINDVNPDARLKILLGALVSDVVRVELRKYDVKEGSSDEDLLRNMRSAVRPLGWTELVTKTPGKGFNAVFTKENPSGLVEFLLVDLTGAGKERNASIFRVTGRKSTGVGPPIRQPSSKRTPPGSVTTLNVIATGPSFQYEAWTKDYIEVQPNGDLQAPDIVTEGSGMRINLAFAQPQLRFPGLGYYVRAPQRLVPIIRSTGSPVTIRITNLKRVNVNAANAVVAVFGTLSGDDIIIDVVNERVVLRLDAVKQGMMRVNATNADITATLPQTSDVQVSANAIAGSVSFRTQGQQPVMENPQRQRLGAATGQVIFEAVHGKIEVFFK